MLPKEHEMRFVVTALAVEARSCIARAFLL